MIIENALDLSLNDLAEAMTHCFEGYIMPAHFTGALEANMIRVDGVDLGSSLIAHRDGEIVGTALIARRGRISRIAAMAVAVSARRQGVGRALLARAIDDARTRNEDQIILEVIEQNPPAIELYKQMGFIIQHRLLGFEGILRSRDETLQPALLGPPSKTIKKTRSAVVPTLKDCSFSDVASALRKRGFLATSWSISPATIEQLASPTRPVRVGDVYAAIGTASEGVVGCRCLAFAKEPSREAVRIWLDAMAREFPDKKLYMPAFFPEPEYGDAFVDSGLSVAQISQFQMMLDLKD